MKIEKNNTRIVLSVISVLAFGILVGYSLGGNSVFMEGALYNAAGEATTPNATTPNATTPTGGSYNSGSKVKHQGVAIWRFVLGGNGGLVKGYVSSGGYTQVNTAGTLDNILIYTYVATKYIKAGSTFKVYGGKYADL